MEILDVVNENDIVVGQATRDECHNNPDLIHRTVHFTLVDKKSNSILVTQRALTKKTDPGKMCFLGEHVLSGETYDQAIRRGVLEELGMDTENVKEMTTKLFTFPQQSEISKFFIVYWNGEKIDYSPDELVGVQWIKLEDLKTSNLDYSDTAKTWIDLVNWESALI